MKTYILTTLILLLSFSAIAQKDREKLKALKVAHITEELELTTKEAEGFWPIYNTYEEEKHKIISNSISKRKEIKAETLSEEEAKALVKEMQLNEEARLKNRTEFIEKLSKVISYKKIVLLMKAERNFKRKMIEEFKGRHKNSQKECP
ncbi:sensor of ECF-type sigma factor [Olleya sp. R77988]|uniref:sensor of ECF-type sigma factor n=1 Tax=Olleya sp. R77988 TaxID=3093875 RepID=UPI0037C89645